LTYSSTGVCKWETLTCAWKCWCLWTAWYCI